MAESLASSPPSSSVWPLRARRLLYGFLCGAVSGLIVKDLELTMLLSYWKPRAPVVVAIILVSAALFLTRFRWLVATGTVLLLALWATVAFGPLSTAIQRYDTREDRLVNADAIFVFASSVQRDGEPTTLAMSRLLHGLSLLGERRAPRLILSELPPPYEPYAPIARAFMKQFNLPGELVTVGPIRSTHDEGMAVGELCRKNGWNKVIAVTSPVHSRRAALVLEHEGLTVIASPSVETRYDLQHLDVSDDRILAFGPAIHELLGLRWYRLRGYIEGGSLAPLSPPAVPDGGVPGPADAGTRADAGKMIDAGRKADAGAKPDAGVKADAGMKADAGVKIDAGAARDMEHSWRD